MITELNLAIYYSHISRIGCKIKLGTYMITYYHISLIFFLLIENKIKLIWHQVTDPYFSSSGKDYQAKLGGSVTFYCQVLAFVCFVCLPLVFVCLFVFVFLLVCFFSELGAVSPSTVRCFLFVLYVCLWVFVCFCLFLL